MKKYQLNSQVRIPLSHYLQSPRESSSHTEIRCVFSLQGNLYNDIMENLKDLLRALECPVCFHLMVPPITMCMDGHNICHTCKPNLKHCPTCRGRLVIIRNKFAEEFSESIEHPCRYKDLGCTRDFSLLSKEEHERKCRYGPHKCPYFIADECKWEGTSEQLEKHIKEDHKDKFTVRIGRGKQLNYISSSMEDKHVVFALGGIFFCYCKVIFKNLYMCYMFVGAGEDNNYQYTVSMRTSDGKHSVSATLPCPHYQEFIDGEFPNEKCAVFRQEFAEECLNEDELLPCVYELIKQWLNQPSEDRTPRSYAEVLRQQKSN